MTKQRTKPATPHFSPQKYSPAKGPFSMKRNGPSPSKGGSKRKAQSPLPNRRPRPPPCSPPPAVKKRTAQRRLALAAVPPVKPATLVQMMNFVKNSKINALEMAQGLKTINSNRRNRTNAALAANIRRLKYNLRKMGHFNV